MKLHPNAEMTPSGRWLLVKRVPEQHWAVSEAAEAAGVSLPTAYKWLARYRDEGRAGLADRRSRPRRIPRRTPARVVRGVEQETGSDPWGWASHPRRSLETGLRHRLGVRPRLHR